MGVRSGNPQWKDYPNTDTPITAQALENIEVALDAATAFEPRGIGMPNGVISASPGTYYTDTAGTNGAWRWLKKTGTGNAGWECIVGDTGWREITSWTTAGAVTGDALSASYGPASTLNGFIRLRRINADVMLAVQGLEQTALSPLEVFATFVVPHGFRPAVSVYGVNYSGTSLHALDFRANGVLTRGTGPLAGGIGTIGFGTALILRGPASLATPWPATLPGTAV